MQLYRRGDWWWFRVRLDGRDIRQSTGQRDRKKAQEIAERLTAPLLLRKQAGMMMDTAKRAAKRLLGEADHLAGADIPLEEAFNKYPMERRDGLQKAPSTVANARFAWRAFTKWAREQGHETLGQITETVGRKYLAEIPVRWAQVSFHILKQVFEAHGLPSPFGRKPARREGAVQHREPLTMEQIRTLLETAERMTAAGHTTKEYPLFLRFLLNTGLRVGDAATLKVDQIDFENRVLERIMAKTGRRVTIPLKDNLLALLPREGEYIFPDLQKIYSHGQKGITHRINIFFKMAGITGPKQAYCAHSLRTTFASLCAERGVPLAVIQSWLGHTSQEVTRIYARVESLKSKREALAKLPDF